MKKMILLILMVVIGYSISYSQEKKDLKSSPAFKFLEKEKIKISIAEIEEYLKTGKIERFEKINQLKKDRIQAQSQNVLVSGDTESESEVHAAINPLDSNNIVISPIRMNTNTGEMDELLLCPIYYTTDFGKNWQKSSFKNTPRLPDAFPQGGGDPILIFDKNGTSYLTWIHLLMTIKGMSVDSVINTMNWVYSTDKGINWVRPNKEYLAYTGISVSSGEGLTEFYDKQWMACDYSSGQFSNNIYLSLTKMAVEGYNILVYTKESGTDGFNKGVRVNKTDYQVTQFSNIDVDSDGNVHVLFYGTDGETNNLYHSISTDGGKTFSTEKKISRFILDGSNMLPGQYGEQYTGISSQRLYPCPQMAIDKSGFSKNIYVTWTANGITENLGNSLDVYFTKSSDGGQNWSTPKVVHDDAKGMRFSNFYPSISVNPNGVLIIGWYDRREDQTDRMTHYYMTYSFDKGETFIKNFPITDVKTDFSTVGEMNSDFGVGEYNMLLSTKGYAIPVWSDGRTGDGNMNIYTAFIPITGTTPVAESVSAVNGSIVLNEPAPNPSQNITKISFNLAKEHHVSLLLKDIAGNEVIEILHEKLNSGEYSYSIDTKNLSSGDYYLNLVADGELAVKKLVVIK